MTKEANKPRFQKLHCTWEDVQIWGLVREEMFFHLSFDRKRHEKLCTSLEVSKLSQMSQDRLCTFLFTLLAGDTAPFPEDSTLIRKGSSFQQKVWRALSLIPFATTKTYGDIARELGNPRLARAVGQACNKNPLPIIIPCHRVVSAGGVGGFAGGSETKKALLAYEQDFSQSKEGQRWPG